MRDSTLCVKSDPDSYGRSMKGIPSITNAWYCPYNNKMIVEGPTCDAGIIGTFIIDPNNGNIIQLPTNCGFIGFTKWDAYIIASEKVNDIDCDLALWYENVYIIDWDGNVISKSSTINRVIEKALPVIHHEAGWDIDDIKLLKHIRLNPKYKDEEYYGNQYEVSYHSFTIETLQQLENLCKQNDHWHKRGNEYHYLYDDYNASYEYGRFVTITIDHKKKTGSIRKGGYSNPKNAPKL